jgi:hypothetical protein
VYRCISTAVDVEGKSKYRCQVLLPDGSQCGRKWETLVVPDSSNAQRHLTDVHFLTATSPEIVARMRGSKQPTLQLAPVKRPVASDNDTAYRTALLSVVASACLPYTFVENKEFRNFVKIVGRLAASQALAAGPAINLKTFEMPLPEGCAFPRGLRDNMIASVQEMLQKNLDQLAGRHVTLAVDSGTVWRRYLTVVALSPGCHPLILSITPDEGIGEGETRGRQTAANVAAHLTKIIEGPLARSKVVAIVADNAANLQAAIRLIAVGQPAAAAAAAAPADDLGMLLAEHLLDALLGMDDDNDEPDRNFGGQVYAADSVAILPQRCFAHAIQLVVRDLLVARRRTRRTRSCRRRQSATRGGTASSSCWTICWSTTRRSFLAQIVAT